MTANVENDMKFMGESSHPGGRFRDISVIGRTRIDGDVDCRSFACMGEARVGGGLDSRATKIMGQMTVAGPVAAGDLKVMGQLDCGLTLRAASLDCMGDLKVHGQVDAEKVRLFGQMVVQGDCNVDDFHSRGVFAIDGLLSVDHLQIMPHGLCKAGEIGGARIEVRRRGGWLNLTPVGDWLRDKWPWGRLARLETQSIEGDDISLEDTTATVIRGARVKIGAGCKIGRVEFRETYSQEPGSEVGEAVQV
jgi:cytoskeletal protein CcmA (bactofilin family)